MPLPFSASRGCLHSFTCGSCLASILHQSNLLLLSTYPATTLILLCSSYKNSCDYIVLGPPDNPGQSPHLKILT